MVTRFYLPAGGVPPISPAFSSSWEETASAFRLGCFAFESDTALTNFTVSHTVAAINDVLAAQYISEPLDGYQVISGTCKGSIKVLESVATADARAQLVIKVVSNDGSTVRGVLLAENNSALSNEYAITSLTRKFPLNWTLPGASLFPVAAQNGDRIVIEIGTRFHVTTTGISSSYIFGDVNGNIDNPEAEGSGIASQNPWIELSQTLPFIRNINISDVFSDGYSGTPDILIQSNLANLCGTFEQATITYYVMRGRDVDCAGPGLTYRTWTVTGDPDNTGFYYFGPKCGSSPLADIIIVKELVI